MNHVLNNSFFLKTFLICFIMYMCSLVLTLLVRAFVGLSLDVVRWSVTSYRNILHVINNYLLL